MAWFSQGGGSALADPIYQPAHLLNLLENPGFDIVYTPEAGVFEDLCGEGNYATTPHVVHWWGTIDYGLSLYAVLDANEGAGNQIVYEVDPFGDPDDLAIHFVRGGPMSHEYLTYRRNPESCLTGQDRLINSHQWEQKNFVVTFTAWGSVGAKLMVDALLYDSIGGASAGDPEDFSPEGLSIVLSETPTEYEWEIDTSTFGKAAESIEVRFGLLDEAGEEDAWLDDVMVTDKLMWITDDGLDTHVELHPEGGMAINGQPFVVCAIDDKGPGYLPDEIQARYEPLGSGGMEFNTIIANPKLSNTYATKRMAQLYLDAAQAAGMKVILWLPLYPASNTNSPLPFVKGLTREWVEEFNGHPALLGWSYGDEVSPGKVTTALDHDLMGHYESIPAVQESFHPLFVYTSGILFEEQCVPESYDPCMVRSECENPQSPLVEGGNDWDCHTLCRESRPYGCLRSMFDMAHVLMPNYHPIRIASDSPREYVPLLAQWAWSAAYHHYVGEVFADPESARPRAVLPVMQFRPYRCDKPAPREYQQRVMTAQAAASRSIGYLAHDNAPVRLEGTGCVSTEWDILDEDNRLIWDNAFDNLATDIFFAYPEINQMVRRIGEKRLMGNPSFESLPPKIVIRGGEKPPSGTWSVFDNWFNGNGDSGDHQQFQDLRVGMPCANYSNGCGGVGIMKFNDVAQRFDAEKVESARLLLSLFNVELANTGACDITYCGHPVPFTHVSRIPGRGTSGDTLQWEAYDPTWWGFNLADNAGHTPVFNHPDGGHDLALQFLASGAREYRIPKSVLNPYNLPGSGGSWDSFRAEEFDVTRTLRYWAADTDPGQRRNNGLFLQAYAPTRGYEPQISFVSSDAMPTLNSLRPFIAVYERAQGEAPQKVGAPFGFFYETNAETVRVYELCHLEDAGESWILVVNGANEGDMSQCVRVYTNRHEGGASVEVLSAISGSQIAESVPGTPSARFIDYGAMTGSKTFCPSSPEYTDFWHPTQGDNHYQPITRWKQDLQPATSDNGIVLVRIPHL
ncbi:MAG: hypothetical protein CME06_18425 [Gemmatimonadetes bacterium]|nr:hypothetical protein [Gemmatimonadota bacterium]